MKKFAIVLFTLIFIAGLHWIYKNKVVTQLTNSSSEPEIHIHAGFVVFTDGRKENFSDTKYMGINPCNEEHEASTSPEKEQFEKAHLHDNVGDVVHVHRDNAVWQDLFTNIHFAIDPSTKIEGYVNGELVENVLEKPIVAYDSVVLFLGSTSAIQKEENLTQGVTKEHIVEVENKGESC